MKKFFNPLLLAGLALCFGGLALNFASPSALGAFLGLAGFLAADKAAARMSTKGKYWAVVFCALLFALSAGSAAFQSAGLGVFIVLVGNRLRNFFIGTWGTTGFYWVEPA